MHSSSWMRLAPQPLIKLERQLVRGKDRPDQLTSSSLPADDDSLAEKPFRQGEATARGRFGARAWCSLPPPWLGVNISGGRPRVGLAVCFSRPPSFGGPRTGMVRCHHVDASVVNKAIGIASRRVGLTKRVSAHTFRHSFATHVPRRGGYTHCPGSARAQGCLDDEDLHARFAAGGLRTTP
jgi:hypothetical protein